MTQSIAQSDVAMIGKLPKRSTKEPYTSATEPYVSAQEPLYPQKSHTHPPKIVECDALCGGHD